ncbi:zinc finger and SCAN domain-containing protein 5B-like, partial [Frankliniella occidentalis]|uniref:Zinc finger and SCAN domain-containing protein 5B-like n=1 Tax=Frankliniella occidentalis TaxID=133901 RepID=A0A9C6X3K3_FRAOC
GALVAGGERSSSSGASLEEDPGDVSVDKGPELDELKQEGEQLGLVVTACFSLQDEQCPAEDAASSEGDPGDFAAQPEQRVEDEVASPPGDASKLGASAVLRAVRDGTRDAQPVQNQQQDDQKASRVLWKKHLGRKSTGSGSGSNPTGALQAKSRGRTGEAFKCEVCEKRFAWASHLKTHKMYHTGEKPFCCDLCQMRFTQKGHLVVHLRTHTGEQPFKCDVCKMRFTVKGHLVRHARTHTGEKPFECVVCKMRFTQKGTLVDHMRTHTGERPYTCDVCSKAFSRKSRLNKHTTICMSI